MSSRPKLVDTLLGLIRAGDPAIASSIFVTTFTDVRGFLLLFLLTNWILGV
jgi:Mg/Co/Ni transporter MgtE